MGEAADPRTVTHDLGLRTRSQTYTRLIGAISALLVVGLIVPFAIGDTTADLLRARSGRGDGASGTDGPTAGAASMDGDAPEAGAGEAATSGPDEQGSGPALLAPGATSKETAPSSETRRASDVGIAADAIKVGVLEPDLAGMEDAGFGVSAGDLRLQMQTFIDELNGSGGINGRRVVPVYERFDPLRAADMNRACIALTEGAKVFIVLNLGGYFGDPVLCIAERHKTLLLIGDGQPEPWYAQADGMLISTDIGKTRILRNMAMELHLAGRLTGKKIGVLDVDVASNKLSVEGGLLPILDQLGYQVTRRSTISSDFGTAQSQIPVAVQQMQSDGVDAVLLVTNFLHGVQFVRQAEQQLYFPNYFVSDMAGAATNYWAERMPDSFDGAVGVTTLRTGEFDVGQPEPGPDAVCRRRYEQANKVTLDRGATEYGSVVATCGMIDIFAAAGRRAGVNPTRRSYSLAVQGLGAFAMPTRAGGSFGPGKLDAPDFVRTVVWRAECKCYLPADAFRRTRY